MLKMNIGLSARLVNDSQTKCFPGFAYHLDYLNARESPNYFKLVGITKVKNEGGLTNLAVNHMLEYCDEVIISDASDTPIDEKKLDGFGRVKIIKQQQPFNEKIIYDDLYLEARKSKATHIMHLDVDERLSAKWGPEELRRTASYLTAGESIAVPWDQLYDIGGAIKKLDYDIAFGDFTFIKLNPPYKDLIYCDDGNSQHHLLKLHCPYIPEGFPSRRYIAEKSLNHLEGLSIENYILKCNKYYEFDYGINSNFDLAIGRYLPVYFKNTRMLIDGPINSFFKDSYFEPCERYINELMSRLNNIWLNSSTARNTTKSDRISKIFDQFKFNF